MEISESIFETLKKSSEDASKEEEIKRARDHSLSETSKDDGFDPLFELAVDVVMEMGVASTSMLQRKLRMGSDRAAKIMGELETAGIIRPQEDATLYQVLITKQQWLDRVGNKGEDN